VWSIAATASVNIGRFNSDILSRLPYIAIRIAGRPHAAGDIIS